MPTQEFYLNWTQSQFIDWLKRYVDDLQWQRKAWPIEPTDSHLLEELQRRNESDPQVPTGRFQLRPSRLSTEGAMPVLWFASSMAPPSGPSVPLHEFGGLIFHVWPLPGDRLTVRMEWPSAYPTLTVCAKDLAQALYRACPEAKPAPQEAVEEVGKTRADGCKTRTRNYGATEKVIELAEAVKTMKGTNRTLTMQDAALQVSEELKIKVTPDAIRYAYRVMGWTWERADRIRE